MLNPGAAALPIALAFTLFIAGYILVRQRHARVRVHAAPAQARVSWLGTYSEGYQRALDVLGTLDARVVQADPNRGTIVARRPFSLFSPGAIPRVAVATQEGVTFVYVEAASAVRLFDPANARRLLNRFLQQWDRLPSPVRHT